MLKDEHTERSRYKDRMRAAFDPVSHWMQLFTSTPVTDWTALLIIAVFLLQQLAIVWWEIPLNWVAMRIFQTVPLVAWIVAPFLHVGWSHLVANLLFLFIFGMIAEGTFSRREGLLFVAISAYGPVYANSVLYFAVTEQVVPTYGSSGIVFALAGYTITARQRWADIKDIESQYIKGISRVIWLLAVAVGILLTVNILYKIAVATWPNIGHLGGYILGVVVGVSKTRIN